MAVAVLGSMNMDISFSCTALPSPGETVLCSSVASGPGGKGLNQAVAASRAGATVVMLGAVGADPNGDALLSFLANEGVRIEGVARLADEATGLAHIVLDKSGENAIVVAVGANRRATPSLPSIDAVPTVYLAQLEIHPGAVAIFLRAAKRSGGTTILNAAPAVSTASDIIGPADIVIVNEHELSQLSRVTYDPNDERAITDAARQLIQTGDKTVIVTLGAIGTQVVDLKSSLRVPAHPVTVVDTTGAGDCFSGVFAAGLDAGLSIPDAVRRANKAASLAVRRLGAASAMPTQAEIDSK